MEKILVGKKYWSAKNLVTWSKFGHFFPTKCFSRLSFFHSLYSFQFLFWLVFQKIPPSHPTNTLAKMDSIWTILNCNQVTSEGLRNWQKLQNICSFLKYFVKIRFIKRNKLVKIFSRKENLVGKKISRKEILVGNKFGHLVKIWSLFSD